MKGVNNMVRFCSFFGFIIMSALEIFTSRLLSQSLRFQERSCIHCPEVELKFGVAPLVVTSWVPMAIHLSASFQFVITVIICLHGSDKFLGATILQHNA